MSICRNILYVNAKCNLNKIGHLFVKSFCLNYLDKKKL